MMGSGPPDHPGYLLIPVVPDSTQATKPLAVFEAQGYRMVPDKQDAVIGGVLYVWMQYGYSED
jgi:hypothetical protein